MSSEESTAPAGVVDGGALDALYAHGGARLVARMIDLVQDTVGQRLAAARLAVESEDRPTLRWAAHSVKSSAGIVGAHQLRAAAERLEQNAEGAETPRILLLLHELENAFRETAPHLEFERRRRGDEEDRSRGGQSG